MSTGAPIEHGTPIRMPSTALMLVNSADGEKFNSAGYRIQGGGSPAEIYINQQSAVMVGYMTRVSLTEVMIQWATPNVNPTNNTLTLEIFNNAGTSQGYARISVAVVDSIVPGLFRTAPLLGYQIENALNANAALTAQFGSNTFQVFVGLKPVNGGTPSTTVQCLNSSFTIETTSTSGFFRIVPPGKSYGALPAVSDDLTNMMGLTPTVLTNQPYYRSITGGFASMAYTPYIDIVSNLLTKNQNVSDGSTANNLIRGGVLARVYFANDLCEPRSITITYGSDGNYASSTDTAVGCSEFVLHREFNTPKQIQWNSTENVDVVDIEIRDYRGNLIYITPDVRIPTLSPNSVFIGNTADILMTFQISEV